MTGNSTLLEWYKRYKACLAPTCARMVVEQRQGPRRLIRAHLVIDGTGLIALKAHQAKVLQVRQRAGQFVVGLARPEC